MNRTCRMKPRHYETGILINYRRGCSTRTCLTQRKRHPSQAKFTRVSSIREHASSTRAACSGALQRTKQRRGSSLLPRRQRGRDGCHRCISQGSSSRGSAQPLKAALTTMLTPMTAACDGSSSTTTDFLVDGPLRLVRSRRLTPPVVTKITACHACWHCCRLYSRRWPRLGCVESRTAVLDAAAQRSSVALFNSGLRTM